jgi:hypothetical protein
LRLIKLPGGRDVQKNRPAVHRRLRLSLRKLKPGNRWVVTAGKIPWDDVERGYAAGFVNNGAPAHPARMALDTLIARQVLSVPDEELCSQVAENPCLQFFIGLKEFAGECPVGASTLVAFRKRFNDEDVSRVNDSTLAKARAETTEGGTDDGGGGAGGEATMALDATAAPSDIACPPGHQAFERGEAVAGARHRHHLRPGRREEAQGIPAKGPGDYLRWPKPKKRGAKMMRAAMRRQLAYVRRDLCYVSRLAKRCLPELTRVQRQRQETVGARFAQQLFMQENKTRSVPGRIVSLPQPWVRPIVRSKARANTELGVKAHASTDDNGMARADRVGFGPFNESELLKVPAEELHRREGIWPDRVLVDRIYRTRANTAWCAERSTRLSGPMLGRRPKDDEANRQAKATERKDAADRNVVERVFGAAKRAYGMDPVRARLEETIKTVIALAILAYNLKKLTTASLCLCLELYLALIRRLSTTVCRVICLARADKAATPVLIGVT